MNNPGIPPSRTITFLFTDIEGSTKLWETYPSAMHSALARHDSIVRSAIEGHGGHVFKTIGDAFCAAFTNTIQALAAVLAAQRGLQSEDWGKIGPVRIRAGIHTGIVYERDGDYFGQSLNRVARLMSAGYGGQILLSQAAYELVRDNVPAGVGLLDLGEHRLKDLIRAEHIFQLVASDLASEFPPLRTLDNRPNNLPRQATPLIGREKEIAEVLVMLRDEHTTLVTLTGPGGTGKTRLALQVGADSLDDFPDGVWFVDLAPLSEAKLVVPQIADTLGLIESAGTSPLDNLINYVTDKHMLLILDNFEQVIDAASEVIRLLRSCAEVKALVTSRMSLRVRGEKEYAVPPLSLPDVKHLPPTSVLSQYEAVRLFIDRAVDIKAAFMVTNENAPAVAEICSRLDGLPLAIELAAARIRTLTPDALLLRLSQGLRILTGGARDLPARQQTLLNTIQWSYDLLKEGEKQLFRRMSVFKGGRTLDALEAVCNYDGKLQFELLDGLEALIGDSLVQQREGAEGEPRFTMLETIHEFACEKLAESGEEESLRLRHALYFMQLVERLETPLPGPHNTLFLERLDDEHENIRAALRWAIDNRQVETALRLAGSAASYWHPRGYFTEGREWLAAALSLPGIQKSSGEATPRQLEASTMKALRAKALLKAGGFAFRQNDNAAARPLLEESRAIYTEIGDTQNLARAMIELAMVQDQSDLEAFRSCAEESLRLFREVGDKAGTAYALYQIGWSYGMQDEALERPYYVESLALARETGLNVVAGWILHILGQYAQRDGDYETARSLYAEDFALLKDSGSKLNLYWPLTLQGSLAMEEGDYETARARFEEVLTLARDVGSKRFISETYFSLALLHYVQADYASASAALDQSMAIQRVLNDTWAVQSNLNLMGWIACHEGDFERADGLFREALENVANVEHTVLLEPLLFIILVGCAHTSIARTERQRRNRRANPATLLGAAQTIRDSFGQHVLTEGRILERLEYARVLDAARAHLSSEEWQAAWEKGCAMTTDEAIAYALGGNDE